LHIQCALFTQGDVWCSDLLRGAVVCWRDLQLLSGGSVDGAAFLASGKADLAFNWAGEQQQQLLDQQPVHFAVTDLRGGA
jgi:hypothetical protein